MYLDSNPDQVHNPEGLGTNYNEDNLPDLKPSQGLMSKIKPHSDILASLLKEVEPIDFHLNTSSPGEDVTNKHRLIITVEQILRVAKKHHWDLAIVDGQINLYNGAYWRPLNKQELTAFLGQAAEKLGINKFEARFFRFRQDLLKQFMSSAHLPSPEKSGADQLVNFKNGTLCISESGNMLRGFQKEDMLFYQLPFNYDPDATAPKFKNFLNQVLPDTDSQLVLSEYLGYLFVKQSTLKLEKALILYGQGANGKSTLFDIVNSLLGKVNVTNYSLNSLTNENGYYRIKIAGALLNYASEISSKMDSTLFKQLVSGEPVEARAPYGEPFIMENYAKLIFNTNSLPTDTEQNHAFFRRFIILEFDVTIPEADRDPNLAKSIIETELAGIFNWVMEGLVRLLSQKKFTSSEKVNNAIKAYQLKSDSVQLFLSDNQYQPNLLSITTLKALYAEYRSYCIESGYKPCSMRVFSERLRAQDYLIERKNFGNIVFAHRNIV